MLDGLRLRRRPRAGAPAQAPDRARGHRRRRGLPRLRRRASDHRRRLQRRRRTRPVSFFGRSTRRPGTSSPSCPETTPEQVAELVEDARRALRSSTSGARRSSAPGRCSSSPAGSRPQAREARRASRPATPASRSSRPRPTSQPPSATSSTTRARSSASKAARSRSARTRSTTRVREPWGVCGQIIPWNYPLQVAARCAAPALAAGNAVILKPSELASITPLRLADLAERRGRAARDVPGRDRRRRDRRRARRAPGVDHVTFVGSAATGAKVAEACARRLDAARARARRQVARTSSSPTPTSTRPSPRSSTRCCRTRARAARRARGCWSSDAIYDEVTRARRRGVRQGQDRPRASRTRTSAR